MPYIDKILRSKYSCALYQLSQVDITSKGELEYVLYSVLTEYMRNRTFCYSDLHDTVYACQHVADEFRRRNLDVRENQAREKNGDI